ncbi:TIGR01777 family oxidoreductase [Streptoalloteichus hindustanus]|nr:TIGR01777 family oxidoreductase [Streptoalloteichus hindustanus]
MRVVVAGSSGLIGTALVPALRAAGHEVVRLVRRRATAPDERSWDPPAGELQPGALDGVDAVVNLCGARLGDERWSAARKQLLVDTRIVPTEVLAGAVVEHGVPVLVNASAAGYYGDTRDEVVTEAAAGGLGFLAELCQRWEDATSPAVEAGVRVARLRTGVVLSPSGGLLGRLRPLFSAFLGARLGDGRQYLSWISLDDALGAVQHVLGHDSLAGPVNLTAPAPVTNAEFTHALGDALGRPAPWVVPGFALRAALGEVAETLLTGQRVVPAALERHGYAFLHPSVGAALRACLPRE